MDHRKRRKVKDGHRHIADMRRQSLECRKDEVAGICDAEQYRGAAQRKRPSNLLGTFRSLWLEIAQGNSIRLRKEKTRALQDEQPPGFTLY